MASRRAPPGKGTRAEEGPYNNNDTINTEVTYRNLVQGPLGACRVTAMRLGLPSGLRWRVAVFAAGILAVVISLVAFLGVRSVDEQTDRLLQQRLVIAQLVAERIDESMSHHSSSLEAMAAQLSKEGYDPAQAGSKLPSLLEGQEEFSQILILDQHGSVVATDAAFSDALGASLADYPCPRSAQADSSVSPVYGTWPFEDGSGVCMAVPVAGPDGAVTGYLVGLIDPDYLGSTISLPARGVGERAYLELVDERGTVISRSIDEPLVRTSEHSAYFADLISAQETDVSTCHSCHDEKGERRKDVFAFAPTESIPWGVVLREPEDGVLAPANNLRWQALMVGGLSLLVILLLTWVLVRSVTRPVGRLIWASERIAAGDLETPVPAVGQDEIGVLARRLDDMRGQLRTWHRRMERWNEELEHTVQHRTRELATLLDISTTFQAARDLDRLLETILARAVAPFEAVDAAALFLYDAEEDCLGAKAVVGYQWEPFSRVRLRPGEGIVGKVFQRREPLLCIGADAIGVNVADLTPENRELLMAARGRLGARPSAVCVPLVATDSTLGALILLNLRHEMAFTEEDIRFLQAVANQAAIVVENAHLWAEARDAEALTAAARFKDEFLTGVSHELLTPVTSIRAAVGLLTSATSERGGHAQSLVASLSRNTQRLQTLLEGVLDLAWLQSGQGALHLEPCDLRTVLEDSVAAVRPLAEENRLTVTVECPSCPCWVLGDKERLDQLVTNLLSNACKFTPAQGQVTAVLEEQERDYLVRITDTGPGIRRAEQQHIFERFYSRPRGPGKRAGSGLGLAIAKAVVELHGGQIWVTSRPGHGSTFHFTLPKEGSDENSGGG